MPFLKTIKQFILDAKKIHGNIYNYSIQVPGWVWPFDCTKCGYDIETEMQVIAVPEGEPHTILHYHVECWEKVQAK